MIRFLLSRLLQGIIVILAVITITFALSRMLPGGPIQSEKNTSPEAIAAQRAYLGLDKPWYEQLGLQIAHYLMLDLPESFHFKGRGVDEIIAEPMFEHGMGIAMMDKLRRASVRYAS